MNPRLKKIAERAASSLDTLQTSYDLARLAIQNNVPGDFVECGVFHGAQCAAMALAIMDAADEDELHTSACGVFTGEPCSCAGNGRRILYRRVHLFDSFAGVPAASVHDKQWIDAGHPEGQSAATWEQVHANMKEWGIDFAYLMPWKGDFTETIPLAMKVNGFPSGIALLRLDGDLYESTKVCIEHLYPLVSIGGWVIVDDFALDGARKAVMDFMGGGGAFPPIQWRK